jgi:sugar phosphate isomerase/epimerase
MKNRREFLQLSGLGILGATLPDLLQASSMASRAKLAVQLYTVRDEIKKDLKGTLEKIARIGYKNVETAFWPEGMDIQEAADALEELNLNVSSCHIELPIGDQKQKMLDTAKAFGCRRVIWHGWPEDIRYSTLKGTRELIRIYNDSNKIAKDNGLQFGLHNHWWEYSNIVGGKLVYEVLMEEVDKDVFFEVDTYWVKVAGHDPAKVITQLGTRAKMLHMKDGPAVWNQKLSVDEVDPMTPLGKGTQNIPAIVKAAKYADWFVVEMDKTSIDVYDALKQSYDYMVKF